MVLSVYCGASRRSSLNSCAIKGKFHFYFDHLVQFGLLSIQIMLCDKCYELSLIVPVMFSLCHQITTSPSGLTEIGLYGDIQYTSTFQRFFNLKRFCFTVSDKIYGCFKPLQNRATLLQSLQKTLIRQHAFSVFYALNYQDVVIFLIEFPENILLV